MDDKFGLREESDNPTLDLAKTFGFWESSENPVLDLAEKCGL